MNEASIELKCYFGIPTFISGDTVLGGLYAGFRPEMLVVN